jgi:hypothetical protein
MEAKSQLSCADQENLPLRIGMNPLAVKLGNIIWMVLKALGSFRGNLRLALNALVLCLGCLHTRSAETPFLIDLKSAVDQLPSYARFSISGLAFYQQKLYVSSNVGLLEVDAGKTQRVMSWAAKNADSVVEGVWNDYVNGSLWVWVSADNTLARFDGERWSKVKLPKPSKGFVTRGDQLRGYSGVSGDGHFFLEGAGCIWVWKPGHGWTEKYNRQNAEALKLGMGYAKAIAFAGETLFMAANQRPPTGFDNLLDLPPSKAEWDLLFYSVNGKWKEGPKSEDRLVVEQAISGEGSIYLLTRDKELFEATIDSARKIPLLEKCRAIASFPGKPAIGYCDRSGVVELKAGRRQAVMRPIFGISHQGALFLATDGKQLALGMQKEESRNPVVNRSEGASLWVSNGTNWISVFR